MNDFIIKTSGLTKIYGKQKSVADLNLNVRKGRKDNNYENALKSYSTDLR